MHYYRAGVPWSRNNTIHYCLPNKTAKNYFKKQNWFNFS